MKSHLRGSEGVCVVYIVLKYTTNISTSGGTTDLWMNVFIFQGAHNRTMKGCIVAHFSKTGVGRAAVSAEEHCI